MAVDVTPINTAVGDVTLEELRSVPLFASLDNAAAVELRELLQARDITQGQPIFCAGESGDAMFLIENGRIHRGEQAARSRPPAHAGSLWVGSGRNPPREAGCR